MGYTGPIVNPPDSGNVAFWNYGYAPSIALGIIGLITFIAVVSPQLWYFVKVRDDNFWIHSWSPFFSAIIEALGYGARLYTHRKPFGVMSFLLGIFLIPISTVLITASMYKSIQRVIKYTPEGRHMSPMRPRSMNDFVYHPRYCLEPHANCWSILLRRCPGDDYIGGSAMFTDGLSTLIFLAGNVLRAITLLIVSIFIFVIYRRADRIHNAATNASRDTTHALIQIFITVGLFFVRLIMSIAEVAQSA
ncbi:uncharacterized protein IAS62_005865 [Cryptococcus decagattii]|uniref:Uncharacterized protein n=1 Tax=Cryptococcus decagattii TaxID=1859122 RepID=A0ABZ2B4F5_9TREE